MIRDAGHDPVVIDYVATGWTRAQLLGLFAAADVTPAQALRAKGTDAAERGLIGADDETILTAMVESPVLVERPIVCGPGDIAQAHQPNEFLDKAQIPLCEAFMRRLIARLSA